MSNKEKTSQFASYRRNIKGLVAPSGELLAHGYIRKFDWDIPFEISYVCTQFVGLYLSFNSSLIQIDTFNLANNQSKEEFTDLTAFQKRLLRDRLLFDHESQNIANLQLETKTFGFGLNGIHWISPLFMNSNNLSFINLSNCYLNDECVEIITSSMKKNASKIPLKWMDISDNRNVTDQSIEYIIDIIDRLNGFNLNCTSVSDKSCVVLSDYFDKNPSILNSLIIVKMDGNKGITESGKVALRPFQGKVQIVLD